MTWSGLRIALVGPLAPPSGGMANQMAMLARLLRQEGAIVTVVRTNRPYAPAWIARWRGIRAAGRLLPYLGSLWRAAGACDVMHVMANSGWSWHLFTVPALAIARMRSVPCVVHYHGGEAEAFLAKSAVRVVPALRAANALIVPSAFLQGVFERHGVASRIVPNVVDLGLFHPHGARGVAPHLVVARNLEAIYDIPTALRAFAAIRATLPSATLSVTGSGPEEHALRKLAADLGIASAVTFTGRLATEEVAALLGRADVMLNPSTADNLPVSILEAMAAGVAVVSTRAGGVPRLVRDGETGLLVDVGDAAAMADCAVRVVSDAALRSRLVHAARADVQQYGWPSVRASLESIYRPLLHDADASRRPA
jgi:glycosyltransferase involved in cell wall biosynthesis